MSGVVCVVRVAQTTNDLVMSLPVGSVICCAVVLAGIVWVPEVTTLRIAASPTAGISEATRTSRCSTGRMPRRAGVRAVLTSMTSNENSGAQIGRPRTLFRAAKRRGDPGQVVRAWPGRCRIPAVTTETRWPETRATQGLVASPHVLASAAGVSALRAGGNARDAAIAAATTIAVVYPHMNSIGGDNVWLIWDAGRARLRGLAAIGRAAASATLDSYAARFAGAIP